MSNDQKRTTLILCSLLAFLWAFAWFSRSRAEYVIKPSTWQFYANNGLLASTPGIPDPQIQATSTYVIISRISAYNALEEQTDETPTTTASGTSTRIGIAANNCLPFGTQIQIEGKSYDIQDRMAKRFGCDFFDVLVSNEDEAWEWGIKEAEVTVNYEPMPDVQSPSSTAGDLVP